MHWVKLLNALRKNNKYLYYRQIFMEKWCVREDFGEIWTRFLARFDRNLTEIWGEIWLISDWQRNYSGGFLMVHFFPAQFAIINPPDYFQGIWQKFGRHLDDIWLTFGFQLAKENKQACKWVRGTAHARPVSCLLRASPTAKENPALRISRRGILGFVCRCSADYTLISTSTPQGSSSFIRASTVLALLL